MVINLIKNREMFSLTLPSKVKGQYWINDIDVNGDHRPIISVEAHKGEWVLKSNKTACVLDNSGNPVKNTVLTADSFFNLKVAGEDGRVILFSEAISASRYTYKKFMVKKACSITIGRTQGNNIVFDNKYVSSNHCVIDYNGSSWSISDKGSTNGTFVNDYRADSQMLVPGDYIYIMGLKIIVGSNYLAINNPDGKVTIRSSDFASFVTQETKERTNLSDATVEYFYRSPRFMRQIETAQIKIDAPPVVQKADEVPLGLTLGPSLTMGIASLSTAVMAIINAVEGGNITSVIPSMCMSISMLLGTILWPMLTKKHERKRKVENEKKRQTKYLQYLDSVRDQIKRECKEQSDILNENIVSVNECVERMTMVKRTLWERVIGQEDFLKLRIGKGNLPLDAEVKYPEKKFTMEDDNLQDAMLSLGTEEKQLFDVPISFSLLNDFISGAIGNKQQITNFTKNLILQMVALHSYDELKIMLLVKDDAEQWEFVRTLPHFWNNDKTARYIATNYDEAKELSLVIEKEILARVGNKDIEEYSPYYVIVTTDKNLADRCEAISQLLEFKHNCGFSVFSVREELKDLPKEVSSVISINGLQSKVFDKNDISGKALTFCPEEIDESAIETAAFILSNVNLDISTHRYTLPNMITFLEMFGASKIEYLNCLTRWKENNPVNTLQAPIGVNLQGEPFYLDLHEKYHGPHGLVAGMTGSGKSEFIITYILSLAVNYHPDEVAFILIDYKGGGLTGAFEDPERGIKLPHLAGTITNLDGAAIKRSLVSIQSELRRRQAIFNEARKISNEGTMDIYKYQSLYRNGVVTQPVPHLFIISDEFAELKSQQPEFMEQLISAARIGRSLGVHLILATQKPSGVVDDQIWSNSKFRVCLKVQDKSDSNDMIKRPDAAELSQTGRFYLQVGFNELFALGQSAWCGAEYIPSETLEKKVDESVEVIDNIGRVVKSVKPEKLVVNDGQRIKQIVAIVKYLSDLANEENISERPLWLDPIPARIFVDTLTEKYNHKTQQTVINPIVGEFDDPFNQRQGALTLPLSTEGNCIVYGASGNGKTTFLTTLTYSLISTHSVDSLNVYIMDFGSETLKAFNNAPHIGGVVTSSDQEKVVNLMKMLKTEFDLRKQLFADFGGDYKSYCNATGKVIPNIVVLINNYTGFAEQFEELEEMFGLLSRDGVKYGITFVVTCSTTNAMRYRYLQNFKQVLTMQLNDPTDYSLVVGRTEGLVPSKFKGRGLINLDRLYEFQTAICSDCEDQYEFVRQYCLELKSKATKYAKRIPVLPDFVKLSDVKESINGLSAVPVGIEKRTLKPSTINVASKYIYPIISRDSIAIKQFVGEFAKVLVNMNNYKLNIIDCENWCKDIVDSHITTNDFKPLIKEIFQDVVERNNGYKRSGMSPIFFEDYEERVIFIVGFEKLVNRLDDEARDELFAMLLKGQSIYKVHFILVDVQDYFTTVNYSDWFKAHVQGNDGLFIGDGFADQYLIKASKLNNAFYDEIGIDFGYKLSKGKATLVKFLTTEVE